MAIHFLCSHCGAKLRVPDEKGGKMGKCPKCSDPIHIPAESTIAENDEGAEAAPPSALPVGGGGAHPPKRVGRPRTQPPAPQYGLARLGGTIAMILGALIIVGSVIAFIVGLIGALKLSGHRSFGPGSAVLVFHAFLSLIFGTLSGVVAMGFGQLFHCIRDAARNSFHLAR